MIVKRKGQYTRISLYQVSRKGTYHTPDSHLLPEGIIRLGDRRSHTAGIDGSAKARILVLLKCSERQEKPNELWRSQL